MIESINLSKHFGSIKAVDHLSFKVEQGEVLGFLGPNGAGKSTTMKMLTCFLTPDGGTAKVSGHDIIEEPMAVKRVIGYLPETAPAYGEMTVQSFLKWVAEIRGMGGKAQREAVESAIEKCFLNGVRYQTIETLSKGYKRRVALAQAIIHDPPVLIMDEPTDGLDPNQKHEVRGLISRMSKGKVIILSTHILEEVDAVCSRAVIIAAGRLVADGTPSELRQKSKVHGAVTLTIRSDDAKALQSTLSKLPFVERVESLNGQEAGIERFKLYPSHGRMIAPGVTEVAREKSWQVLELHVDQGHLDDVFRELTSKAAVEAAARDAEDAKSAKSSEGEND